MDTRELYSYITRKLDNVKTKEREREMLSGLLELVSRARHLLVRTDGYAYYCPNCGFELDGYECGNYCEECGQALKFTDENTINNSWYRERSQE